MRGRSEFGHGIGHESQSSRRVAGTDSCSRLRPGADVCVEFGIAIDFARGLGVRTRDSTGRPQPAETVGVVGRASARRCGVHSGDGPVRARGPAAMRPACGTRGCAGTSRPAIAWFSATPRQTAPRETSTTPGPAVQPSQVAQAGHAGVAEAAVSLALPAPGGEAGDRCRTVPPAPTPLLLNKALGFADNPYRVYGWIQNSFTGNANGMPRNRRELRRLSQPPGRPVDGQPVLSDHREPAQFDRHGEFRLPVRHALRQRLAVHQGLRALRPRLPQQPFRGAGPAADLRRGPPADPDPAGAWTSGPGGSSR